MSSTSSIDPRSLADATKQDQSVQLLDVRTPAEFEDAHIPGSKLAPLDSLKPEHIRMGFDSSKPFYVVCRSGNRAAQAIHKLEAAGCEGAVLLEGGINAWQEQNLPVNRGKTTMNLERQVRIAAGLLVLTGCALGYWFHPLGFALAAFTGAGLTFAGITDTCAMGTLIAKLPWNQRGSAARECSIGCKTSKSAA